MYNKDMTALGQTRSVIRELFEYGNQLAKKIGRENVFDFTLGNPSVPTPKDIDDAIVENVRNNKAIHGYTSAQGSLYARQRIAQFNQQVHHLPINAEHIYMTCGAAAGLAISLRAVVTQEQDEVVIFKPYFPEYRVFAQNAGAKVVEVGMDENFQIDLTALKDAITNRTCAVIINSPNNPSGIVYTNDTLEKLAQILSMAEEKYNHVILLICDEPYREIVFENPIESGLNFYNDSVLCYSFSKSFSLAGERIGFLALSNNLTNADDYYSAVMGAGRALGYVCAPSLMQQVVAECAFTPSNIIPYREHRDILASALQDLGFRIVNPQGAFYMLLQVPYGDALSFANMAKEYGLLLVPTDTFGLEGYVRIATCVSTDMINRSLPVFEKFAKAYFQNNSFDKK